MTKARQKGVRKVKEKVLKATKNILGFRLLKLSLIIFFFNFKK